MDLFQSYIRRFNDVQTPVLAMSHTMPRFISDPYNRRRFEAWRESYRRQINSWKAHLQRVKFDVESRRLASTWDGRQLFKPPAQQISLVCNYCTKPLSQQDPTISTTETSSVASTTRSGMTGAPSEGIHATPNNPLRTPVSSGTVCPKCGRHMPRCGVCSLWLGSVDPMSKGSIAEDEKKRRDSRQIEKRTSMDSSAAAAAAAAANNSSSKSPTAAVRNVDDLMKRARFEAPTELEKLHENEIGGPAST
ncbi:hypothetical protein KEM55_005105 [Ascosphaera atra]|nr:hypothetical protein KEM55_005105 [Ascosphaera atra]